MDKYEILKDYFGHSSFRQGQEELIDAILSGRDALGVMPTGGGKSLCYQIPALLLPGVSLVISPLISLMKDQVAALRRFGISAAYINSSLTLEQLRLVYDRTRRGAYKLLYVAPERLGSEDFLSLVRGMDIPLVSVDEAHCISQWGQDFRPSYLKIADFIEKLPRRPVLSAFTATATAEVQRDIVRLLRLNKPCTSVTGFDRPNLYFEVQSPSSKLGALLGLLREREDKSGIIYCATRTNVERVCDNLCDHGFAAVSYHAGLDEDTRRANQDAFQFDEKSIMVATNAFGMGIDKSNVSFVIHYNMPKSMEAYYQEAGRAGRDGTPADCILLFSAGDIETAKFLIDNGSGTELSEEEREQVKRRDRERLQAMIGYCKTNKCLRGYILDYFGQKHAPECANCGNCKGSFELRDVTVPAQMLLSCIARVRDKLGYTVGKSLIIGTVRGSRSQRIQALGLDGLSTYGLLRDWSAVQVQALLDFLHDEGFIYTESEHSTIRLTPQAAEVLFRGKKLSMPVKTEAATKKPKRRRKKQQSGEYEPDDLFTRLKALRLKLAQQENVPAYVIFPNATLLEMSEKLPQTRPELLGISGIGQTKANRYGEAFLEAIREYLDE